jgi:diguanylate cyclase
MLHEQLIVPERMVEDMGRPVGARTSGELRSTESCSRLQTLEMENHTLKRTVRRLRQLAFLDGLTGLPNRRHFDLALESEVRRARRSRTPLALIFCDLDHFKRVNDTLGHQAGDDVLRVLGRVLSKVFCRAGDLAARFGGEEFAVLLPGVDAATAPRIALGLCESIAARPFVCGHPARTARITVSVGVTTVETPAVIDASKLVRAADTALLTAKRSGRNCIRFQGLGESNFANY